MRVYLETDSAIWMASTRDGVILVAVQVAAKCDRATNYNMEQKSLRVCFPAVKEYVAGTDVGIAFEGHFQAQRQKLATGHRQRL